MPGEDGDSLAEVGGVAAVDEGGAAVLLVRQGPPVGQALEVVAGKGLAGLDLDGDQLAAVIEEEVDFMAGRVPPEIEIGLLSAMLADLTSDVKSARTFCLHVAKIRSVWYPGGGEEQRCR